jgi:hypothetical protein
LLGPLGGERTVAAECVFVDPIADIAVLGSPDDQVLSEEAEAYEALIEDLPALSVKIEADASDDWEEYHRHPGNPLKWQAWLISLDGRPQQCFVTHIPNGPLWIEGAADIAGGMSGSPILAEDGETVVGVVCNSSGIGSGTSADPVSTEGGPNPRLAMNLPGRLMREFSAGESGGAARLHLVACDGIDDGGGLGSAERRDGAVMIEADAQVSFIRKKGYYWVKPLVDVLVADWWIGYWDEDAWSFPCSSDFFYENSGWELGPRIADYVP